MQTERNDRGNPTAKLWAVQKLPGDLLAGLPFCAGCGQRGRIRADTDALSPCG